MLDFYKNKRVLVTGHTGFKGSWLTKILISAGAEVSGYSISCPTEPSLFKLCGIETKMNSNYGDIRDLDMLEKVFRKAHPQIVIHLAAQPIVRNAYLDPCYTYGTNVMGTVNLLECVRKNSSVKSVLNVTTDKVYKNNEWEWGYRENDSLDGFDPYSNSKSCSEMITGSYNRSFLNSLNISVSTVRAGNVIGGGDFAKDRIIPDCVRAIQNKTDIIVRNPHAVRPYQHVLDPLYAYLLIAQKQYENMDFSGSYNVGPNECDCVSTGVLADMFCNAWGRLTWINQHDGGPHEASFLRLDCSKIKSTFGWQPKWPIKKAIERTVEWTKVYLEGGNIPEIMDKQICDFFDD